MKSIRNLLLTSLVVIISNNLSAQLKGISPLSAGGSFSDFEYARQSDSLTSGPKPGGTGGIRFDFDLGVKWAKCSPELFVIQNGSKEYYTSTAQLQSDIINQTIRLNYFGMYIPFSLYAPIQVDHYDYQSQSREYGHVGGISNGFFLTGSLYGDLVFNASALDSARLPYPVQFRSKKDKYDAGFTVTGGFAIKGITIRVGYAKGLKNIRFANPVGTTPDETYIVKNNGFILTIGYTAYLSDYD